MSAHAAAGTGSLTLARSPLGLSTSFMLPRARTVSEVLNGTNQTDQRSCFTLKRQHAALPSYRRRGHHGTPHVTFLHRADGSRPPPYSLSHEVWSSGHRLTARACLVPAAISEQLLVFVSLS